MLVSSFAFAGLVFFSAVAESTPAWLKERRLYAARAKRYSPDEKRASMQKMFQYCINDCIYIRPGGNCGPSGRRYKSCGKWEKLVDNLDSSSVRSCKVNCEKNHGEAQYCDDGKRGRVARRYYDEIAEEEIGNFDSPVVKQDMMTWTKLCNGVSCPVRTWYTYAGEKSRCPGGRTAYKRRNVWRNGRAMCCHFACCSEYNPSQRCLYRL